MGKIKFRNNQFLRTSLAFMLVIVLIFTGTTDVLAKDSEVHITILGTSDIHGRYMPWDYPSDTESTRGSLTQISTIIKEIKEENPNTILMDAGDLIQDNSAELFTKMDPHPAMEALNTMGFDVWTMGNHEFDWGFEILDNITPQFKGSVLAGNVYKDDGERYYDASTIIEKDGVKIGIIGMTTPMVAEFKQESDIFDGKELRNPVDETKKAVEEIEGEVDVIVGLMHMGMENENNVKDTGLRDMANAIPEMDVIFGGHMHALHEADEVNGVLIVEPDKYGRYLSRVDLSFKKTDDGYKLKDKKGSAIKVADYESDLELEKVLEPFHKMAREDVNTSIGKLIGMDMVGENEIKGIPRVQIEETPLTNFFGELMLHYSNGADVVAHQIDNDDAKLDIGDIRKKDIAYNYQYAGGEVTVYEVTGKDLKDYMEWSASYFNTAKPGDVTVSFNKDRRASKYSTNDIFYGVKYEIDLSKDHGNRISNLRYLDETPIKPEDEIKLGMNAYRMRALIAEDGPLEGREYNKIYSTQDEESFGEVEGRIRNLAARYIRDEKDGVYKGHLLGNWKIKGIDKDRKERKDVIELINDGILEIPSTEEGLYTNIASINVDKEVTKEEIRSLAKKAHVDIDKLGDISTTGELYTQINKLRKLETQLIEEDKKKDKKRSNVIPLPKKKTLEEYHVESGDVLWKIAEKYGIDWKDLARYNDLKNPHKIYRGQKLLIPAS